MAKRGRPSSYKPEYCEAIIKHMADGSSAVSFAVEINVDRDTLTQWQKVHPDFAVAFKKAQMGAQKYWEDLLKRGTSGEIKGFNVVGAIFAMKNRFALDWREKQETHITGTLSLSDLIQEAIKKRT